MFDTLQFCATLLLDSEFQPPPECFLIALQKKSAEVVGAAKSIAQFLDRDTRSDFASTVMIPSIQEFLKNPNDIDGLVKSIQKQKESIFAS